MTPPWKVLRYIEPVHNILRIVGFVSLNWHARKPMCSCPVSCIREKSVWLDRVYRLGKKQKLRPYILKPEAFCGKLSLAVNTWRYIERYQLVHGETKKKSISGGTETFTSTIEMHDAWPWYSCRMPRNTRWRKKVFPFFVPFFLTIASDR